MASTSASSAAAADSTDDEDSETPKRVRKNGARLSTSSLRKSAASLKSIRFKQQNSKGELIIPLYNGKSLQTWIWSLFLGNTELQALSIRILYIRVPSRLANTQEVHNRANFDNLAHSFLIFGHFIWTLIHFLGFTTITFHPNIPIMLLKDIWPIVPWKIFWTY